MIDHQRLQLFDRRTFFRLPPRQITVEDNVCAGRTYFIDKKSGAIVAVAELPEGLQ